MNMISTQQRPNNLISRKSAREGTEWVNFWVDNANLEDNGRRILLVGDSTSRVIRRSLGLMLGGASVDLFATSAALTHIAAIFQLTP